MAVLDLFQSEGKNALVTGSSQGLGAGMAIALAQAGANVALHGRNAVSNSTIEEVEKTGVAIYICDLATSATQRVCTPHCR